MSYTLKRVFLIVSGVSLLGVVIYSYYFGIPVPSTDQGKLIALPLTVIGALTMSIGITLVKPVDTD